MDLNHTDLESFPFTMEIIKRGNWYETNTLERLFWGIKCKAQMEHDIYLDIRSYLLTIHNTLASQKEMFLKTNNGKFDPKVALKIICFIGYYNELVAKYNLSDEFEEIDLSMEISVLLTNIQRLCKERNISIDKMLMYGKEASNRKQG